MVSAPTQPKARTRPCQHGWPALHHSGLIRVEKEVLDNRESKSSPFKVALAVSREGLSYLRPGEQGETGGFCHSEVFQNGKRLRIPAPNTHTHTFN